MNYKIIKKGKNGITAKIVADSIAKDGTRITTFELEYPRFIHSELMTHREFSRNAASSRAIPVDRMIDLVDENTAMPIKWVSNQRGMQSHNEIDDLVLDPLTDDCYSPDEVWNMAKANAILYAKAFKNAGYHKQIVNRLLEPFQMMKTIVTATSYDNFFALRYQSDINYDAQHEIHELAMLMYHAYTENKPIELNYGDWHLPYYQDGYYKVKKGKTLKEIDEELDIAIKISCSCSAQVSYRRLDDSIEKALNIYDKLVNSKPVHASAFEHCATPMDMDYHWQDYGITHCKHNKYENKQYYYSGNFKSWIQYRQLIDDHYCEEFVVNE